MPKSAGAEWMSTSEAAARLGVTLRTLYRLIDQGDLAAYKLGRVIRLRTMAVEAYRKEHGDDEAPPG